MNKKVQVMHQPIPGKPNEYLQKNDGNAMNVDEYRSLIGLTMFFMTKLFIPRTMKPEIIILRKL